MKKSGRGRPTDYRPEMCANVVALGAEGKSLTQIACALDISRETMYRWIEEIPAFSDAISKSLAKAQAEWERKGDDLVTGELKGSAPVYIFLMKNRFRPRPDDAGENYADRHELTGKDGGDLTMTFALPVADFDAV